MVLHKLPDVIHSLGFEVVLVTSRIESAKSYPVLSEEDLMAHECLKIEDDDWVVYPEIIDGNPLGIKNVVRWLLNVPGERGGNMKYGKDDLYFHYSHNFISENHPTSGLLHVGDYGLDYFKREKRTRFGFSIMIRKSRDYRNGHFLERAGWPVVDFLGGLERSVLNRYFNSLAIFVSYDTETYHSVQAALSGALSIVVPRKERSRKDFYNHGAMKYGVAYGLRGIPWALITRKRLRDYLNAQEEEDKKTVISFLNFLQQRS